MRYQNNTGAAARLLRLAMERGAVAAAAEPANAVRLRLRGGYTSGDFVTGTSSASVTQAAPEWHGTSVHVRVGTNVKYAPYWEFGHFNLFTRKYERVEVWRPGFLDSVPAAQRAFNAEFRAVMGDSVSGPSVDVRGPARPAPRTYTASVGALNLLKPRG